MSIVKKMCSSILLNKLQPNARRTCRRRLGTKDFIPVSPSRVKFGVTKVLLISAVFMYTGVLLAIHGADTMDLEKFKLKSGFTDLGRKL